MFFGADKEAVSHPRVSSCYVKVHAHPELDNSMLIPFEQLGSETLTGLIEDFVTRDGTDNGDETPLETRIERVRRALDKKQAVILFDVESQQCQLCLRRDVPKELLDDLDRLSELDPS